ncbi:MAG: patatin [Alphaproteobacteria bacterium]|nr:MAG: patatin [Alphaproteobacteria bacterium]
MARAVTRPRIGLALGSGSARGWAHIGVIEALIEAGVEPEIVCGASIGALVGAAYVADRLPALKEFAEALTWREIVRLLDVRLSGGGLINGKRIVELLRKLKIAEPIESYDKPYAAVAADLETGREVWLCDGPIDQAVRASVSLPGIVSPTRRDGRWLADGGLVNPIPVSTCRALGADIIIAVNLNNDIVGRFGSEAIHQSRAGDAGSSQEFLNRLLAQTPSALRKQATAVATKLLRPGIAAPSYFDVLTNSLKIMQDQITRARLAGEPPHVMLMPKLQKIRLMEFDRAKDAIASGRACAEEALPALRRYV